MSDHRLMRVLLPTCVVLLLVAGCNPVGRRDARERNNRIVSRAYELMDAGAYREAAGLFREALDVYPTMARPHLDLALILHEHRRDYVRAIYHYERYLALRPATEKAEMIRTRVLQARAALVASYGVESVAAAETVAAAEVVPAPTEQPADVAADGRAVQSEQEAAALRQERDGLRVAMAELERLVEQKQSRIQQLEAELRRTAEALAHMRAAVPQPVPEEAVGSPAGENDVPPVAEGSVRTYEVRANDSLSVIAHRVYGDATKWRVIQAANREVLGNSEMLRIGQVLVIPEVGDRR